MTVLVSDPDLTVHVGDALDVLRSLPSESVDLVACSPPFYALRDYGVEGQIGLEESPELWSAALVGVFAECRRVLRPAGSMFVECGDSYASSSTYNTTNTLHTEHGWKQDGERRPNLRAGGDLKPKDLLGQPFLLAQALRAPRYTGRISDERDRIWLAAMIDAEGCIFIHKRKVGQSNGSGYERKNASYGSGMEISNTSRAIIERVSQITGRGSVSTIDRSKDERRRQTLYRWNLRTNECREVLREVYPHLVAKQHEARLAIGCPSSGDRAEAAHVALKGLHRGAPTDIDFPAPPLMFEPGWYWRGVYPWSKPNCMPESAKDRCTTAHSYVLHFAKNARYFFDGDAIAEPAAWERWGDQTVPKYEGTDTATGWMQPKTKGELQGESDHRYAGLVGQTWKPTGRTTNGANGRTDEKRGFDNRLDRADGKKHPRSVWTIPTRGYEGAHFATWPEALAERIIKAGCPEGGTVLDPFFGSGTTGLVSRRHGRRCIGIELNPEYARLAAERCQQLSLLAAL